MPLVKQESYPNPPPMWFAESEDAKIAQILEFLSSIEPSAPNLVRWVHLFFNFDEIFPHNFEEWPYVTDVVFFLYVSFFDQQNTWRRSCINGKTFLYHRT